MLGQYSTVTKKMGVKHLILKLILFHMLVAWCSAKYISIHNAAQNELLEDVPLEHIQDNIKNLIHTGIYSHQHLDTADVQVVTPVKVSSDGALISRTVEHSHDHGHPRARRDLFNKDHEMAHSLHYNLTVDGRQLRLDLRPSVTFITPALIVERRRAGEHTRSRPSTAATDCHYTGSVRGQPASKIAISACDGLAGLLRTEYGEYWIEPSKQVSNDSANGRQHVVFKRSAVDKVEAFHRAKRSLEANINNKTATDKVERKKNFNPRRRSNQNRETIEKRRREHFERLKRLEALRKNPTEYRRQQMNLRKEQRIMPSNPSSRSSSIELNKSLDTSEDKSNKNRNKMKHDRRERKRKNKKNKKRRRRRAKNCATIQPPYQWSNITNPVGAGQSKLRNNKQNRYHHSQHSRRARNGTRRSTRSVSKPRHVEVLLVADKSMSDFHNEDNLETYLLTIMNMVSSLYMDPSIGNYIKVVVVKIIMVEEAQAEPDLKVSRKADETLRSFCHWQHKQNPDDDDNPHHHDVAILVTRQDICRENDIPCSTLGVAHVAGMCQPDRSCSVNEDNGIMLAHTITHELGHNFGLYHDTEEIGCHRREGSTLHIMTPYFETDTVQVAWSRCSKRDVTMFLDAGMGECLGDRPSQEYVYPEMPAGAMFDAEIQCRLQFGVEAAVCSEPSRMCEQLWCLLNGTCKSMLRPPADGTTCGENMWCENQKCVKRMPVPSPRDGGWGAWSPWSECSRTCGAGVSLQTRECNNPKPLNNGNYCIGDRSRYKICNTDPCPKNMPSFREVQCSKYNNFTYNNETIAEWISYFDQDKPCELQCIPRDNPNDELGLGKIVADGTPCRQNPGARDMCIAGVCYKVGCDWIVDSDVEEDECGVCGGDGSACKTVQGIYTKGTTKQNGFSEVAVIPAGSRNVKIVEKVNPGNFISIGSAKTKKFYFNGARNETLTEYFVAGSQAIYERDRDWEKVRIPGPIAEDIKVYQRIFRGKHRNPGVTYQYTVDRQRAARGHRYRLSAWTPCSVTCGRGYTYRHHQCVDQNDRVVDNSRCYDIEGPRNEALMQQCQVQRCRSPPTAPSAARALHVSAAVHHAPAPRTHWWVGAWNLCNKSCTKQGEEAIKSRNVYCVNKTTNKVINDSECDYSTRPIKTVLCADVPAC